MLPVGRVCNYSYELRVGAFKNSYRLSGGGSPHYSVHSINSGRFTCRGGGGVGAINSSPMGCKRTKKGVLAYVNRSAHLK